MARSPKLPSLLDHPRRRPRAKSGKLPGAQLSQLDIPSLKEEEFVRALLTGATRKEAYVAAGGRTDLQDNMQEKYAGRLLESPRVRALLEEAQAKARATLVEDLGEMTASFVRREYIDVYREARREKDRVNSLRALEGMRKILGMDKERELSPSQTINNLILADPSLADKEILRLAKAAGVTLQIEGRVLEDDDATQDAETPASRPGPLEGEIRGDGIEVLGDSIAAGGGAGGVDQVEGEDGSGRQ